jgi:hypothetical protein
MEQVMRSVQELELTELLAIHQRGRRFKVTVESGSWYLFEYCPDPATEHFARVMPKADELLTGSLALVATNNRRINLSLASRPGKANAKRLIQTHETFLFGYEDEGPLVFHSSRVTRIEVSW